MRTGSILHKAFDDAVDDGRLYSSRFSAPMSLDPDNPSVQGDELVELVKDEAEKIERTANCVTVVDAAEQMGVFDVRDVDLFCLCARDADTELIEALCERAQRRVWDQMHDTE